MRRSWRAFAWGVVGLGVGVGGFVLLVFAALPADFQPYALPFVLLIGGIVVVIAAISAWGGGP